MRDFLEDKTADELYDDDPRKEAEYSVVGGVSVEAGGGPVAGKHLAVKITLVGEDSRTLDVDLGRDKLICYSHRSYL